MSDPEDKHIDIDPDRVQEYRTLIEQALELQTSRLADTNPKGEGDFIRILAQASEADLELIAAIVRLKSTVRRQEIDRFTKSSIRARGQGIRPEVWMAEEMHRAAEQLANVWAASFTLGFHVANLIHSQGAKEKE